MHPKTNYFYVSMVTAIGVRTDVTQNSHILSKCPTRWVRCAESNLCMCLYVGGKGGGRKGDGGRIRGALVSKGT